ncbi:MAG: RagB/SusD family nutrient uptake outer membrane protein [Odoribacteraceae bacterium]|jgi:hypothetical protein|nr:RagB/SusD family nutrient uptake outer membrane protein [Odoribacteraceae bacterium]
MKNITSLLVACLLLTACGDSWLEREPKNIVTEEQVWNDSKQILSLLANYYDRMPTFVGLFNTGGMTDFDDAVWAGHFDNNYHNNRATYPDDLGRYWDYALVRDINLALENIEAYSKQLTDTEKTRFINELRFIRVYVYFELVKRMGGVPLITTQLIYNFDGDPTPLQQPRAKEADIYDFIATEIDQIKDNLGNEGSRTRANKYTALALKSRAMLYAASIAKYGVATPDVTLPGGEVGIPATRANEYYQASLAASTEIISNGDYRLYEDNPDKGQNFYDLFMKKTGNPEIIFAKDYSASKGKKHGFAYDNIIRVAREDNLSSSNAVPTLNLVECFDYLDGSSGKLRDKDAGGQYIAYERLSDIFANKDARLHGTIVYPGTSFRGIDAQIQAGVAIWNGSGYDFQESNDLASTYTDGGVYTGASGPQRNVQEVGSTGFYLRKLVSDVSMASTRGVGSENWWPWFRLGEIYLNAAEAAFELNLPAARDYINTLREKHGGFAPGSVTTLTTEIIRNERRVELAFEDHRFFDLKRWRVAHEAWNGQTSSPTAQLQALYPYRVIGGPDNGKYIFERINMNFRGLVPRYFQRKNYYSSISQTVINNNPKIIPNPLY